MMNPETVWTVLQQQSGATGDSLDLSKIPPEIRNMSRMMAERAGTQPLPETGIMTKQQFLDFQARNDALRAARQGNNPSSMGGYQQGPGGNNGNRDMGLERLTQLDQDRDGRVSRAEADDRLRPNFDRIDTNGDGFITLEEFRAFYANQNQNRNNNNGNGNGNNNNGYLDPNTGMWVGGGPGYDPRRQQPEEIYAIRYGKLPPGLEDWFTDLDSDKDGQIGLYEWRAAKRNMEEFVAMDLDGDGLITADEYLRYKFQKAEADKAEAYEKGTMPRPTTSRPSMGTTAGNGSGPGNWPPGGGPGNWPPGGGSFDKSSFKNKGGDAFNGEGKMPKGDRPEKGEKKGKGNKGGGG